MSPIIGVTCGHQWEDPERFYVNASYIKAVEQAGGTPILIPYLSEDKLISLTHSLDGLLLPGGIDIDAQLFNEPPHPGCGAIDPIWDKLDLTVIQRALHRDIPILAICRGVQILNVAAGGNLVQDIASQITAPIKHMQQAQKWYATHSVNIKQHTILAKLLQCDQVRVNSFHHQAVKDPAPGFVVSATASDGVVEAIESTTHRYVLGVQWHPELMLGHYPCFQHLFSEFIAQARMN